MSDVIFEYSSSAKMRNRETVATGKRNPANRNVIFSMSDLTPDQRAVIMTAVEVSAHRSIRYATSLKLAGWGSGDKAVVVSLRSIAEPGGEKTSGVYAEATALELDDEPTLETAVALTDKLTQALRDVIAHSENVVGQKTAVYNECVALFAADEVAAVEKAKEAKISYWKPEGATDSIMDMHNQRERARSKEINDRAVDRKRQENERREAEKAAWIAEHGSDHLREAFGRGYDSQRQYVLERAHLEATGWTLDFNESSDWNNRSFPSVEALRVEDEAVALAEKLNARSVGVVWLTKPPTSGHDDYYYVSSFEACEAVAIREYLGQYDLVKMID